MPVFSDAECAQCNHIFEISKNKIMDDFIIPICPKCGSKMTKRKWKAVPIFVAEGMVGNAKNGYQSGITYHPSTMGKIKGTKLK